MHSVCVRSAMPKHKDGALCRVLSAQSARQADRRHGKERTGDERAGEMWLIDTHALSLGVFFAFKLQPDELVHSSGLNKFRYLFYLVHARRNAIVLG